MRRRDFLALAGASLASRVRVFGQTGKRVLTFADFDYVGAFRLATSYQPSSSDLQFARGLASRRVNGELRFFTQGNAVSGPEALLEVKYPGVSTTGSGLPVAPLVRTWGNVYQDKKVIQGATGAYTQAGLRPLGFYFDEPSGRIFWSYLGGDDCYTNVPTTPTLGTSRLDDVTGIGTADGAYTVTPIISGRSSYKSAMRGVVPIPQAFANAHLGGGSWFGVGFGGYFSLVGTGGASLGPALWAVRSPIGQPHMAALQGSVKLLGTTTNTTPYTRPMRGIRNTDYHSEYAGDWPPKDGIGYWTWSDQLWGNVGVWIDLPDAHGFLVFPRLGEGRVWYEASNLHAERVGYYWYGYDPTEFGRVLQGQTASDLVTPGWQQRMTYVGGGRPFGVSFDPVGRTLWILLATGTAAPQIHGWRVRDLAADLLPAATGGLRKETP